MRIPTNHEKRARIAKHLGWTAKEDEQRFWRAVDPKGRMLSELWVSERNVWSQGIPDYLNSLDDCHEMEKALDVNRLSEYADRLDRICVPVHICPLTHWQSVICSEAHERAEAFGKTCGLW